MRVKRAKLTNQSNGNKSVEGLLGAYRRCCLVWAHRCLEGVSDQQLNYGAMLRVLVDVLASLLQTQLFFIYRKTSQGSFNSSKTYADFIQSRSAKAPYLQIWTKSSDVCIIFFFYVTVNTKPFSLSINLQRLTCFSSHFIRTLKERGMCFGSIMTLNYSLVTLYCCRLLNDRSF